MRERLRKIDVVEAGFWGSIIKPCDTREEDSPGAGRMRRFRAPPGRRGAGNGAGDGRGSGAC